MLVLEWKERAFIEKVNSRCFCWFPAAILVDQTCPPIWLLHTKLYKSVWNISANNSETVGHKQRPNKDLRFGQIVYIRISFLWHFIFLASSTGRLIAWQWKRKIHSENRKVLSCQVLVFEMVSPAFQFSLYDTVQISFCGATQFYITFQKYYLYVKFNSHRSVASARERLHLICI